MDASVGSDPNESQATQLLHDLLENDTNSSKLSDARGSSSKSRSGYDLSLDSLPSRHSNTVPQYHFHGLASTQTQTQHYEEEQGVNGGSQKENIEALNKDDGQVHPQSSSRSNLSAPSSSRAAQNNGSHGETRVGANLNHKGSSNRNATLPTVIFPSLRPKVSSRSSNNPVTTVSPSKPPMSRFNSRYTHSHSDSQDSFACDSDKAEERFLARSDKFALPLSELGKLSSPMRGPSNVTSSSSYHRSPSPPTGRVLVEATPSHSGSSQSDEPQHLSQQLEATQLVDDSVMENQQGIGAMTTYKDGNGSGYESSEPSSSYHRFLDGKRDSEPQMQATQPSTQVDDSGAFSEDAFPWSNIRSAPGPSGSSAPQSLLSLVAPQNRWRYRQHQQNASSLQTSRAAMPPTLVKPSVDRCEEIRLPLPTPAARSFPPLDCSIDRGITSKACTQQSLPLTNDVMDVVPDSEPMAEQRMKQNMRMSAVPAVPAARASNESRPPQEGHVVDHSDVEMDAPDAEKRGTSHRRDTNDEDEEEEIPLATVTQKLSTSMAGGRSTRRGAAIKEILAPHKISTKAKAPTSTHAGKGKTVLASLNKPTSMSVKVSKAGKSWETGEVPSSIPEQDHAYEQQNLRSTKNEKTRAQKGKTAKAPSHSGARRGSKSSMSDAKSRVKEEKQESDIVDHSDDEVLMQTSDYEDGTEPADEDYQEDEDDFGSKKRKRIAKAPVSDRNTRGVAKRSKRNAQTPVPRQSKRLRSVLSTASRINMAEATRVFALWRHDCHYYPGTVHSTNTDSEYLVKFDDDTDSWVSLDQMRLSKMHVGDDVLIANRFRPSRVVNVDDQEQGEVVVNVDDEEKVIQISSLRIASKTIKYDWADRILTPQSIVPVVKPVKTYLSPSPSKLSMLSVPSVRGDRKKVLAKTGLIITLTAHNGDREKTKVKVMSAVKNSGGLVIDDLSAIIRMEGKHTKGGRVWIINKKDVEWIGDEGIERLFLIADEANQKPKFLTGLALGIPCLDTKWLFDSVEQGEEKEWLGHLLPQGFSQALASRPTQQVDMDWGNSHHHLTKIMENTVPCKLFAKKSILCVGPDVVPQPKGRKRAGVEEKPQEAMNALPRIILAMGAETVEAVVEPSHSSKDLSEYDYIVIREQAHYSPEFAGHTTVHWSWVKESLIASRCLPLPAWPSIEYSQEA